VTLMFIKRKQCASYRLSYRTSGCILVHAESLHDYRRRYTSMREVKSEIGQSSGCGLVSGISGVARGGFGGSPPIRIEAVFFHSRKVTAIKYYNVSLKTRRTINSHNLRKTNHLGRVVRLLAW